MHMDAVELWQYNSCCCRKLYRTQLVLWTSSHDKILRVDDPWQTNVCHSASLAPPANTLRTGMLTTIFILYLFWLAGSIVIGTKRPTLIYKYITRSVRSTWLDLIKMGESQTKETNHINHVQHQSNPNRNQMSVDFSQRITYVSHHE